MWTILDNGNICRHKSRHRGINKFNRKTGCLGGEAKKIDNNTNTELAGINAIRHAKTSFGYRMKVPCNLFHQFPAIVPTLTLEDSLDSKVGGA